MQRDGRRRLWRQADERERPVDLGARSVRDGGPRAEEVEAGERQVAFDVQLLRDVPEARARRPADNWGEAGQRP